MTKEEKKHKCPCCDGKGSYYQEGDFDHNGGIVTCDLCDQKGYLTEAEYSEIEEFRKAYNIVMNGDPPRVGIFSKRLKKD